MRASGPVERVVRLHPEYPRAPLWRNGSWYLLLRLFFRNWSNIAQVGFLRCSAADRVARGGADEQVEVGAHRPQRVVAGRAELGTALPPAVLAHDHTWIEVRIEPGAGAHAAFRRLDRHPVAVGDPARLRRRGMQLHCGMWGALAQTRQRVVL